MSARILFVDDEAPIREMLSLYFRKKGYTVTTASESAGAIELARDNQYDLIILDVDLGGENGMELLSLFKRQNPKLPIIMFTGLYDDEELLKSALARGADGFMRKSESLDELFSAVRKHLPES